MSIYTYFQFWFSVYRCDSTVHHNALGCGLGNLQLIRWDHLKSVTMMAVFRHNHCHCTYKLSNVNKSSQTKHIHKKAGWNPGNTFTIHNLQSLKEFDRLMFSVSNTDMWHTPFHCTTPRMSGQPALYCHVAAPRPSWRPNTLQNRLTPLKSRWIVKVPLLPGAVVDVKLGGLRNDVYEDDDRARKP